MRARSRSQAGALAGGAWRGLTPQQKRAFLDRVLGAAAAQARDAREPYPWQRPHVHPPGRPDVPCDASCRDLPDLPPLGAHEMWLLMGGRGTGKTDAGSTYVLDHVAAPPCDPRLPGGHRIAIVAPTLGDAVESCVSGPSGLQAYDRRVRLVQHAGGSIVKFPGGSRARLFGAHTPDDVNRLRSGGNTCLVWLEEAAAMRRLAEVLEHSALGLRMGATPHYVASTTPKVRPEIRDLMSDPSVARTRGRTRDARYLNAAVREKLERKYAGTRTGRQELEGELLTEVEGALWAATLIDPYRVKDPPSLSRVVVGLDPNAGGPDEAGIIVAGLSYDRAPTAVGTTDRHLYVLDDRSFHASRSGEWARAAIAAYYRWEADAIVVETNNGGDMAPTILRGLDPDVRVVVVNATRGKAVRAEPVVGLYEQGRVHHVGALPRLEDQQTTWTESESWSPDRMDALVWACTYLALPRQRQGNSGGRATAA